MGRLRNAMGSGYRLRASLRRDASWGCRMRVLDFFCSRDLAFFATALIVLMTTATVRGASKRKVNGCAAISSPTKRLACFDKMAVSAATPTKVRMVEGWGLTNDINPIDDTVVSIARVAAIGELQGWPSKAVQPSLLVRCSSNELDIYVATGMSAAGDHTMVTYRFDKTDAEVEAWKNSTDSEALFFPSEGMAMSVFLTNLQRAEQMLFQITPFNSSPTMVFFNLSGAKKALEDVAVHCPRAFNPSDVSQEVSMLPGRPRMPPALGFGFRTVDSDFIKRYGLPKLRGGAAVVSVETGSYGELSGLRVGDVIVGVKDAKVRIPADFASAIKEVWPNSVIPIQMYRGTDYSYREISYSSAGGALASERTGGRGDDSRQVSLSMGDIVGGVKTNAGLVMPCLKAARSAGEIVPGSYKLILDWRIEPDGSVTGGKLKGPPKVIGTSLPACFSSSMKNWRFPPSHAGAPIRNFPFGPFTVK